MTKRAKMTKSEIKQLLENNREKVLVMAAKSLLYDWLDGKDIEEVLDDPKAGDMIIEVGAELGDNHTLEEWLKLVEGDGNDSRRRRLKNPMLISFGVPKHCTSQ